MDNLTAILYKTNDIRMEQTPIPTPGMDIVIYLDTLLLNFIFFKVCNMGLVSGH